MAAGDLSVTQLLHRWSSGDAGALPELVDVLYPELRRLARIHMRRERLGHTLAPTALVHEAYLRLVDQGRVAWSDRRHFLAVASRTMRRLLVEFGRARGAKKRRALQVSLREDLAATDGLDVDVLALVEALERFEKAGYELETSVVELRFFGGLSIAETAEQLGVAPATVGRAWAFARVWLFRELEGSPAAPAAE